MWLCIAVSILVSSVDELHDTITSDTPFRIAQRYLDQDCMILLLVAALTRGFSFIVHSFQLSYQI
jgi:hypothetical protein